MTNEQEQQNVETAADGLSALNAGLDGTLLQNECPNCHVEMEGQRIYVDVGRYGTDVWVYICQECAYAEAETS